MDSKYKILLTNDDGIHARGLKTLWKAVKSFSKTTIIAPTSEKSGTGLSQSLNKPLKIHQIDWPGKTEAWAINGTPTDCMKLGFHKILKEKPDLILSGINHGSNAGRNVLYSGTIGSVIEGVQKGVPGIAFSCYDFDEPNHSVVEKYIPFIVKYFLKNPIPRGTLINVNFPEKNKKIQGIKFARQGLGFWSESPDQRKHPSAHHYYYWLGGKWVEFEEPPESDVSLLNEGYIAIVPIYVEDFTHHTMYKEHKAPIEAHLNDLFNFSVGNPEASQ